MNNTSRSRTESFLSIIYALLLGTVFTISPWSQQHAQTLRQTPKAVINVDFSASLGKMQPIWAWFGYDEPNYTYMKDGRQLLTELSAISTTPVYVRTHSLLCTGDGEPALKWGSTNAYTEDAQGNPVYNWRII